jgi:hypothetical protein
MLDGGEVPPFSAFVFFNGFPAGVIDPAGGILAVTNADDAQADDAFIRALVAARGGDPLPAEPTETR